MFGPVLAVGLGGVWVEMLRDVALRLLPVTEDDVYEMLTGLAGYSLLTGGRGRPPADLAAAVATIRSVADAALVLGGRLAELEVNPLLVSGKAVEALDALVVTTDDDA